MKTGLFSNFRKTDWTIVLLCTLVLLATGSHLFGDIVINEILAANRLGLFDEDGQNSDWVEIYNSGTEEINLAGHMLSDDPLVRAKYILPEVMIAPGDTKLIWCSGKNRTQLIPQPENPEPELHTNFKLDRNGDLLILSNPDEEALDTIVIPPQVDDRSYGRFPDGAGDFFYMLTPTPRQSNNSHTSTELIPSTLEFNFKSGVYNGSVHVEVSTTIPFKGLEIRFRKGGSIPTLSSEKYSSPIVVNNNTVIRAQGYLDGIAVTPVSTQNYLLESRAHALNLPIMTIAMPPEDFAFIHLENTVRGFAFEREGHIEFFKADKTLDLGIEFGLRLHGGAGRDGDFMTKKSYRAYFRSIYGDGRLNYPVIPDTQIKDFDKLVLRGNFNDAFRWDDGAAYIRDQLVRDLHRDMGGYISHGSWYSLYVNGEYRGNYNVVERLDREYMASYFPADGDNWDVIKHRGEALDGDLMEWELLLEFMRDTDLSTDTAYDEVKSRIDLDNFTAYMICQIWAQNSDWPQNNWYVARPRRPDGKWIFFVWDAELGMGLAPTGWSLHSFAHAYRMSANIGLIFARLVEENLEYQRHFLEEMDRHMAAKLSPENVLSHIDRLASIIEEDMDEEANLIESDKNDIATWRENVEAMREFARNRGPVLREKTLNTNFILSIPRTLSIDPARFKLSEGAEITLSGQAYSEDIQVMIANDSVEITPINVTFVSSMELKVSIPFDASLEGTFDITVTDPVDNSGYTMKNALEILEPTFFRRGDANGDESINITDAVTILRFLFGPISKVDCEDALDLNDSGDLNIADATHLLNSMFLSPSTKIPAPSRDCIADPTHDTLNCDGVTACPQG